MRFLDVFQRLRAQHRPRLAVGERQPRSLEIACVRACGSRIARSASSISTAMYLHPATAAGRGKAEPRSDVRERPSHLRQQRGEIRARSKPNCKSANLRSASSEPRRRCRTRVRAQAAASLRPSTAAPALAARPRFSRGSDQSTPPPALRISPPRIKCRRMKRRSRLDLLEDLGDVLADQADREDREGSEEHDEQHHGGDAARRELG